MTPPRDPAKAFPRATSLRLWIPLTVALFVLLGLLGLWIVFERHRKAEEQGAFENMARVNVGFFERTRLSQFKMMAERLSEITGLQIFFWHSKVERLIGPPGVDFDQALLGNEQWDGKARRLSGGRMVLGIQSDRGMPILFVKDERKGDRSLMSPDTWLALAIFWLLSLVLVFGLSRWVTQPLRGLVKLLPLVGTQDELHGLPLGRRDEPIKILTAALLCALSPLSSAKPLKVFILAGQSNMEGYADISTFDYISKDPKTAPLLKEMRNPDGTPRVCDKVWMSYLTGPYDGSANGEGLGKLTAGFGGRGNNPTQLSSRIGPEFTFGIFMEKELKEPILIIKTAWGGRSLNTEFRPPSAGPYKLPQGAHGVPKLKDREKWQDEKDAASGVFYRMMVEHVKKVLADPKRVCPVYDPKDGCELAGFVWLQGFNDLVDGTTYPNGNYDEYSRLLAHFIRDVRKDLSASKMPFVIGVLGVEGDKNVNFRKAMAAPAKMPEFKGNVVAVDTAPFWDTVIEAAQPKQAEYNEIVGTAHTLKPDGNLDTRWKWGKFWKPVGKLVPKKRNWRFVTVNASESKDILEKYDGRRFRDITLPAGMENWYMQNFDDSKWTEGNAPIGKGVWCHSGITLDKFPSTWGKGEFLLMRSTFEVDSLDYDSYRLAILARQGFHVYLNGQKIHTYAWSQEKPQYSPIVLEKDQIQHLKKGKNVLAVYANDEYSPESPEHYSAIDAWIEGITKEDQKKLDLALEKVLSPKDREVLKGASDGDYHYFGSAKIFSQMGKAFAEANLKMMK